MKAVYDLRHYKIRPGERPEKQNIWQDVKDLGTYSSESEARAAVRRRQNQPGFRDWPDGFRIEQTVVDPDTPLSTGDVTERVFRVWHFRIGPDDEDDTEEPSQHPRQLGTYSTEANAAQAIERHRQQPEYRNFPGGFRTYGRRLDVDHWEEGFVSWDEA